MAETKTPAAPVEKTVRVYNRSQYRSFIHEHAGQKLVLAPSSFLDVPEAVAARWLSMFEGEVAEGGVAQKELAGLSAQLAEKDSEIAKLKQQLEAAQKGAGGSGKKANDLV